jgi:uncharacterized protein YkwD
VQQNSSTRAARVNRRSIAQALLAMTLALVVGGGLFVSSSAPADAATTGVAAIRTKIIRQTNAQRAAKGCRPLKVSTRLTKSAQSHANDMSRRHYFAHDTKGGLTWDRRIRSFGWKQPGGENIARGYKTAQGVMQGWMASKGHRRNILDCNFRYIGVGYAASGNYWVQDFGY